MTAPKVSIVPHEDEGVVAAVAEGGGRLAPPAEADAVVWTEPMDPAGLREVLQRSPARWVQLPFAGIEAFVQAGVIGGERLWTCTKGVYGYACAEHALALLLAAAKRLHDHARARSWRSGRGGAPERLLRGRTVVLVGTGGIGGELSGLLRPFDVRLLAVNRSGRPFAPAERTVTSPRLPEVVTEAAFVVLAAALTPQSRHIVNEEVLSRMNEEAWLVNVARGGLVDTAALVHALQERAIGGAALDVTDPEPLPEGHPLWELPNCLITPHTGNTEDMAVPLLSERITANVRRFAAGEELLGGVDPDLGY